MGRFEIRWHGRGGMGAVTAAELTAMAAVKTGYYAVAFPEFGAERRGAPVKAYTRIDDEPIYEKTPIEEPDAVVVLDSSMVGQEAVLHGLKSGGWYIANTARDPEEVRKIIGRDDVKVATVNATKLAMEVFKAPIVNTAMIGALVAATGIVPLEKVEEAVRDKFPERYVDPNIKLLRQAYESVRKVV